MFKKVVYESDTILNRTYLLLFNFIGLHLADTRDAGLKVSISLLMGIIEIGFGTLRPANSVSIFIRVWKYELLLGGRKYVLLHNLSNQEGQK